MDRNHCQLSQAACESCFGGRIELREFGEAGCVMDVRDEDDTEKITFFIKDRDGSNKVLHVNQENWPEAYNSWMLLYQKQQAAKATVPAS
jgi:hypothetical protein